jgi:hypothetical protein
MDLQLLFEGIILNNPIKIGGFPKAGVAHINNPFVFAAR